MPVEGRKFRLEVKNVDAALALLTCPAELTALNNWGPSTGSWKKSITSACCASFLAWCKLEAHRNFPIPVEAPAARTTKSPATATPLTGDVVALEKIALEMRVQISVPRMTYSLLLVGAMAQVVANASDVLAVILAICPAPVPRTIRQYPLELENLLVSQDFVGSTSWAVLLAPEAALLPFEEAMPRSPLMYS